MPIPTSRSIETALTTIARRWSYSVRRRDASGNIFAASTCPNNECGEVSEINLTELALEIEKELER